MRQNSIFVTGLAVFSGLTSFIFVYYAVGIFTAENPPEWNRVLAYVAAGYGLGNIYILSWAWRIRGTGATWANKLIALCFFGVFLLDRWKVGVASPLEYVGILAVAGVLLLNWFAVKKISERHTPEVKSSRPRR